MVEKRVGRGSCGVVTMSSTAVVERALSSCGWSGQLVEREWRTGGEVDMCLQLWWLHKHNWWRGSGGLVEKWICVCSCGGCTNTTGGEVDMCLQLWWLHKHNWWRGSGGLGFPTAPWGNK